MNKIYYLNNEIIYVEKIENENIYYRKINKKGFVENNMNICKKNDIIEFDRNCELKIYVKYELTEEEILKELYEIFGDCPYRIDYVNEISLILRDDDIFNAVELLKNTRFQVIRIINSLNLITVIY